MRPQNDGDNDQNDDEVTQSEMVKAIVMVPDKQREVNTHIFCDILDQEIRLRVVLGNPTIPRSKSQKK